MTEDEMVGWHLQLNGHEFEQAPGVGEGQGSPAGCGPWLHEESGVTEGLNRSFFENPFVISIITATSMLH